jgi:hypothetical protein
MKNWDNLYFDEAQFHIYDISLFPYDFMERDVYKIYIREKIMITNYPNLFQSVTVVYERNYT